MFDLYKHLKKKRTYNIILSQENVLESWKLKATF